MGHLLIVDLPGGNDSDILSAALDHGYRVTLLTAEPAHYLGQPHIARLLTQAAIIDADDFAMPALIARLQAAHQAYPYDAVLCLQDLRITEAAHIALALGLRHLNPETAALCRDKAAVRRRLAAAGIEQPPFALVRGARELVAAAEDIGLPLVIKPADGFGSQNIFALREPRELQALRANPQIIAGSPGDYGLGVTADGAMLVERLMQGQLIGCDTFSADGQHRLLGVNEKIMFAPPSFAIRGGCFTANCGQFASVEAYVFALLDAVGFDHGAAHIELMLTGEGPHLVEINPRLVGARIGRLISAALGRSVHADLITLHTEGRLPPPATTEACAVTRWLAAPTAGTLREIRLPASRPEVVSIHMLACAGDPVTPPYDNADRLGCVITAGQNRAQAETCAEEFIAATEVLVDPAYAQVSMAG